MPICTMFNRNGEVIREFDTNSPAMAGGAITIGRSSQCKICLKGVVDRRVGRIHVSLQPEGKLWAITNCSSTSLYRNEQEVTNVRLEHGDIVRFGHTFLAFGEGAGPTPYELAYADAEGRQERRVLWPGRNTIGSSTDNTISIKQMGLSRSHAQITMNPHDMLVEDAGSSQGTFLDEQRVKSLTSFESGAVLRLGKAHCHILPRGRALERKKKGGPVESSRSSLGKWVAASLVMIVVVLFAKWRGWL